MNMQDDAPLHCRMCVKQMVCLLFLISKNALIISLHLGLLRSAPCRATSL